MNLERLVEKGFAVALSKTGRSFHVRAVRDEKVIEGESGTMFGAVARVFEETMRSHTNIRSR